MALVPDATELRDKVRFERRATGANVGGVTKQEWTALGVERSARVLARMGGEGVLAARQTGTQPVEITVRSDSGTRSITTDDRAVDVRDPTRVFAIRSIADPEAGGRRWLNMLCDLGGTDGR